MKGFNGDARLRGDLLARCGERPATCDLSVCICVSLQQQRFEGVSRGSDGFVGVDEFVSFSAYVGGGVFLFPSLLSCDGVDPKLFRAGEAEILRVLFVLYAKCGTRRAGRL